MDKVLASSILSVIPIRLTPSNRSEMVSQVLFGEYLEVLDKQDEWLKIRTLYDDYEGWVDEKQIIYLDSAFLNDENIRHGINKVMGQTVKRINSAYPVYLPLGASLSFNSEEKIIIGNCFYELGTPNHFTEGEVLSIEERILATARQFLDAPYLWGGRTHFGIDCSGFSQIVYKVSGLQIKRDAWQQARQGDIVDCLKDVKTGDLAFFDNAEGRITHVGIMINSNTIIHASGRVKIDLIDDQGIFSSDLKCYSHKLKIIKRYI